VQEVCLAQIAMKLNEMAERLEQPDVQVGSRQLGAPGMPNASSNSIGKCLCVAPNLAGSTPRPVRWRALGVTVPARQVLEEDDEWSVPTKVFQRSVPHHCASLLW
jgi:hypothetical protein